MPLQDVALSTWQGPYGLLSRSRPDSEMWSELHGVYIPLQYPGALKHKTLFGECGLFFQRRLDIICLAKIAERPAAMAEGEVTTFTALTEKFNLPAGNYKLPKLLYCSNGGHFLRILPDGTVDGTRDRSDQHIQLQLSAESVGEVYIKSTETGQYLAMDTDGLLYGSQTPSEECLFLERLEENHYNTYTSKKHAEKNWFVGLKKNGSCKRGPRTHYGQKAILFLPLPVSSD
nr:fibroblast growth factor 1 isoform X1 [Oryctolagus cuniculus]